LREEYALQKGGMRQSAASEVRSDGWNCHVAIRRTDIDVQPDLFGTWYLIREWGRIGARGQIKAEHYENEALATIAMQRQAGRKNRRGYKDGQNNALI
jgi:predicted DNA-binding WGR domain protein